MMKATKLLVALLLMLGMGQRLAAQGIVYFSYGTGVWVGEQPRSFAPIAEFSMDLNGDGVNDFRFVGENPFAGGFYLEPQNQNAVLGYLPGARVRRLAAGADISVGSTNTGLQWVGYQPDPRSSAIGPYLISSMGLGSGGGEFAARFPIGSTEGYVGVRFFAADGLHYGWIRVRGGYYNDGRILDYAFNTVPGDGLAAGAEPGSVPGPAPELRLNAVVVANGGVLVSWPSVLGQGYRVEYKTGLNPTNWTPYLDVVGTKSNMTIFVSPTNAAQFFQVNTRD